MLSMIRIFAQSAIEEYQHLPEITDKANALLKLLEQVEVAVKEIGHEITKRDPKIAQIKEEALASLMRIVDEKKKNLN